MGRTWRSSAMDQTFFRSVTESSHLATGTSACITSNAFTDPAFLTFWASMEFGVPAWTSTHVYDWEFYGIISAIFVCYLGNFLICLLGIFEFFSSSRNMPELPVWTWPWELEVIVPLDAIYGHIVSCKSLVTLFPATFFPSILSAFVVAYCIFCLRLGSFHCCVPASSNGGVNSWAPLCSSFNQYAC